MLHLLQANPRASEDEPAVWGPHVAECVMRGAKLQWPYGGSCDFLWDVTDMFQHYVWVPWVSPFPEVSLCGLRRNAQTQTSLVPSLTHTTCCIPLSAVDIPVLTQAGLV